MVFEALLIKLETLYSKRPSTQLLIKIEGILNKQLEFSEAEAAEDVDTSLYDYQTVDDLITMNSRFKRRNKKQIARYSLCQSGEKLVKTFSAHLQPETLEIPVNKPIPARPSYADVGEALGDQLVVTEVINRATQTDWKWAVMARIWGHGRLVSPTETEAEKKWRLAKKSYRFQKRRSSVSSGTSSETTTDSTRKSFDAAVETVQEETQHRQDEQQHQQQGQQQQHHPRKIPLRRKTSRKLSAESQQSSQDEQEEQQAHPSRKSSLRRKASDPDGEIGEGRLTLMRTLLEEDELQHQEENREGMKDQGDDGTSSRDDESSSLKKDGHTKHHRKHWTSKGSHRGRHSAPLPEIAADEPMDPNDKCVDTVDLNFNPYDPALVYTKKSVGLSIDDTMSIIIPTSDKQNSLPTSDLTADNGGVVEGQAEQGETATDTPAVASGRRRASSLNEIDSGSVRARASMLSRRTFGSL